MAPALSILLPTYNGGRFIEAQIASILRQTVTDFELLVIDDGSSDNTVGLVQQAAQQDPRIQLMASQGRRGQRARLLELLKTAQSELIAFSDQDDIWADTKLQSLMENLGGNLLAFGRSEMIDEYDRPLGRNTFQAMNVTPGADFKLRALCRPLISAHCALVVKHVISEQAFSRLDPFDWMIFLEATFTGGVAYVPDAVVHHRIHGNNQSNAAITSVQSSTIPVKLPRGVMAASYVDRFSFFKKLEHLATSMKVDSAVRACFVGVAKLCLDSWLIESPLRVDRRPARLEAVITESLMPLAGSPHDAAQFRRHLAALTSGFLTVGQKR